MFLSQPPTARRPSMASPLTTVSMASAITSRETREYFIPSVPIEMASLTVGVPNICGIVPAALSAESARAASAPRPKLHGVMLLCALATPTMGLVKSPSRKPTARSMARFPARSTPWVVMLLRRLSAIRSSRGRPTSYKKLGGASGVPPRPPATLAASCSLPLFPAGERRRLLLLLVHLDDALLAAARHRNHYPDADGDHEADDRPRCPEFLEEAGFPQRGDDAADEDHVAEEIDAHPLHRETSRGEPPRSLPRAIPSA